MLLDKGNQTTTRRGKQFSGTNPTTITLPEIMPASLRKPGPCAFTSILDPEILWWRGILEYSLLINDSNFNVLSWNLTFESADQVKAEFVIMGFNTFKWHDWSVLHAKYQSWIFNISENLKELTPPSESEWQCGLHLPAPCHRYTWQEVPSKRIHPPRYLINHTDRPCHSKYNILHTSMSCSKSY